MPDNAPVQKPLSLVLQFLKPPTEGQAEKALKLGGDIAPGGSIPGNGILHFAWVIPIDFAAGKFLLSTVYDGDFEKYLDVFIDTGHANFDATLPLLVDAPPTPVQEHRQEFYDFVRRHDIAQAGKAAPLFSAYPTLTVVDIIQNAGS